jgi:hypothetical protein
LNQPVGEGIHVSALPAKLTAPEVSIALDIAVSLMLSAALVYLVDRPVQAMRKAIRLNPVMFRSKPNRRPHLRLRRS